MKKNNEEYDFMEEAFRDEVPAAAPRSATGGDEGDWLDAAFRDEAPIRRKMSGKAKAAIVAAVIVALVLVALLFVESVNALGAFIDVAVSN